MTYAFLKLFAALSAAHLGAPAVAEAAAKYFVVKTEAGRTAIFFTGHEVTGAETDALATKLRSDPRKALPRTVVKPADYPAFLKGVRTIKALTPDGIVDLGVVEAQIQDGCSNAGFFVRVKSARPTAKGLAVLDGSFAAKAKLRIVDQPRKGSEKPLATLATKVWTKAIAGFDAKTQEQLKSTPVGPASLSFVRGTFPNGATWLVWVSEDLPLPEPPEPGGYVPERTFRFGALADAKGEVLVTLQPAALGTGDGIGRWVPDFVTDVDGDGTEEVVASPSYYEGGSTVLYRWLDGKMTETTLYGAGC